MTQHDSLVWNLQKKAIRFEKLWQLSGGHSLSAGHLEMSGKTAEHRARFQYDHRWDCGQCREYKEDKEGRRILAAFADEQMWVTEAQDRRTIQEAVKDMGVGYVVVPILDGFIGLTTGKINIEGVASEQVSNPRPFVSDTVMKLRWLGSLSSSRGLLPPARMQPPFHEAYHPGTSRRCWHLHETQGQAEACAHQLKKLDGVDAGWYIRRVSEWRKVGRFAVTGDPLRTLADHFGIKTSIDLRSGPDLMTFEPMTWTDTRFRALRERAGWTPPHSNFQPPPLDIEVTVKVNKAAASV